jgi:hypothetical protein
VLGIAVIISVGLLVIITSLTIEPIANFIQRRLGRGAYRRLEWISTGTLQLQRQLYEAHGVGDWRDCDELIPVLEAQDAMLPVLDISDQTHPLTKRRSQLIRDSKEARLSEVGLPADSDTSGEQDHSGQQMIGTEQEDNEAVHYDVLGLTETISVDEQSPRPETPTATSEIRGYRGPVSAHDVLERRTNTYSPLLKLTQSTSPTSLPDGLNSQVE